MVWGLGGRNAPEAMGSRGERSLLGHGGLGGARRLLRVVGAGGQTPASDQPAIRLDGSGIGLDALKEPQAGGMQRGRAAGPLAKMVLYYKTHLASDALGMLRLCTTRLCTLYYSHFVHRSRRVCGPYAQAMSGTRRLRMVGPALVSRSSIRAGSPRSYSSGM